MNDYYLGIIEGRTAGPYRCSIISQLKGELEGNAPIPDSTPAPRSDFALVRLDNSIPKSIFGGSKVLKEVVLATRHQGRTLFPPTQLPIDWDSRNPLWPIIVMVFSLTKPAPPDNVFDVRNLVFHDFGVLAKTLKQIKPWMES